MVKLTLYKITKWTEQIIMNKLVYALSAALLFASQTLANPWEVREGSTLLDGTETATYIAGYMFSGKEFEMTSSQVKLTCEDNELLVYVVGDSDLLTERKAQENPTIEVIFKAGSELTSFRATIENVNYGRERARVHNGPELLEFFRRHAGGSAQVQLPVARTGVPEVRKLSLKNVVKTTDLVLSTCGPLEAWELTETSTETPSEVPSPSADEPALDLETALSVGLAKKIVEELITNQDVTFEQIVEALKPLKDEPPE